MGERVTVFVAEDHPLYRSALEAVIDTDPGLALLGSAADGTAAFEQIARLRPEVSLLDVRMPGWDGPELARRLASEGVPTRVLFLSEYQEGERVYEALEAGGAGYLSKRARHDEIRDAIRRVARGEPVLSEEAGEGIVARIHGDDKPEVPALTSRELQVLRLMVEGCSGPQMGERLHLSTATVKSHTLTLYRKLGVSDRGAAVAEAMRRGLVH